MTVDELTIDQIIWALVGEFGDSGPFFADAEAAEFWAWGIRDRLLRVAEKPETK